MQFRFKMFVYKGILSVHLQKKKKSNMEKPTETVLLYLREVCICDDVLSFFNNIFNIRKTCHAWIVVNYLNSS